MAHVTDPKLPRPHDPPFLLAILIGAKKTGDKMMADLAREWLAEAGIRISFAADAPALRPTDATPRATHGGAGVRDLPS